MPTLDELTKQVKKLKDEDRWKASSDVDALARVEEIRRDPARLKRAKLVADQMAMSAAAKAQAVK